MARVDESGVGVLPGGWRKKVSLTAGGRQLVCFVSKKAISARRLSRSLKLEERMAKTGVVDGRRLLKNESFSRHWRLTFSYLPGEVKWRWGRDESVELGRVSARLHRANVCHFDLKPGNVLWNNKQIAGVIDYEEAKEGKRYQAEDLANTLSWVFVSGGSKEAFIEGYQSEGLIMPLQQVIQQLPAYLRRRRKEGSPRAFLLLAQKHLTVSRRRLAAKLLELSDLAAFRRRHAAQKIVFVVGAFELLHWGHFVFLKKAKRKGDLLVVGVASDASRRRLKGESFPLVGEKTRAETLAFFDFVRAVVIVDEDDVLLPLRKLKPAVFFCAVRDWQDGVRKPAELAEVTKNGGQVVQVRHFAPQVSSSTLVEQVALRKINFLLGRETACQPILKVHRWQKRRKELSFVALAAWGEKWRQAGKIIVFTSLTADLFHLGHARFLQKAKSLGDLLVVGLPSNTSVTRLKGPSRPMVDQTARAQVLAELEEVDRFVIFDQPTVFGCLQQLKPHVFFTVKEDWNAGLANSPEANLMRQIGGKIIRSERQAPYLSASKMIDRAAGELIRTRFRELLKVAHETSVLEADFDPFAPQAQLAARERGFYDQVLARVAQLNKCVFCDLKDKYLVAEQHNMVLTVALYPYLDGHLLIIPRRHVEALAELTDEERQTIFALYQEGARRLEKKLGLKNFWLLLREGEGIKTGKTVNHLHFHLLPYEPQVIKMGEKPLSCLPEQMAQKLRSRDGG
jgi:rfaE bifunctional protein nucleotidyltransferase chain/domain